MIYFETAFPIQEDADLIRVWRNDPISLAMSFSYREVRTLANFFPDYIQNYFSMPSLPPLFAISAETRIGILRFDPASSANFYPATEISLLIAPERRSQGYGTEVLLAVEPFLKRQGIGGVVAQIMHPNEASLKVFKKAGYEVVEEGEIFRLEKTFISKKNQSVFIIAEAGSNWYAEGDKNGMQRGLQMIEAACKAGADAIKFQTFRRENIYVPNPGTSDYLNDFGIKKDINDLFKDIEITEEMLYAFANHCTHIGIEFMSSAFSPQDFALIDPLVKRHKIASYEIVYKELITLVANSNKPLILSTGAANVTDIDWAVAIYRKEGGKDLTLLQCTAKYPAAPETMNLEVIPWLKSRYQVLSGLSDHSAHPFQAPLAAVALGADCIEKHFTLDRTLKGPDHSFAIEPHELKELVTSIRAVEAMRGTMYKNIQKSEEELYFFCRRGIQALQDIPPGEILKKGVNIAVLRPGKRSLGVHPKHLTEVEGKKANHLIKQGEGLQFIYLE